MSRIYKIQAKDVVEGMLTGGLRIGPTVARVLRRSPSEMVEVEVELPGPSPRDLCCTCHYDDWPEFQRADCPDLPVHEWLAAVPPERHASTCPVAPQPGIHGGMTLWPVNEWRYCGVVDAYLNPQTDVYTPWLRCWSTVLGPEYERYRPPYDYVLQCFYLPPVQPEQKPTSPGWDPYGSDLDLAVRHG